MPNYGWSPICSPAAHASRGHMAACPDSQATVRGRAEDSGRPLEATARICSMWGTCDVGQLLAVAVRFVSARTGGPRTPVGEVSKQDPSGWARSKLAANMPIA